MILGKIFYRGRLRKPINEAVKWKQMKEDVINKKDVNEKEALARAQAIKTVEKSSKKIFEITVKECKNLKRLDPNFNPRLM